MVPGRAIIRVFVQSTGDARYYIHSINHPSMYCSGNLVHTADLHEATPAGLKVFGVKFVVAKRIGKNDAS